MARIVLTLLLFLGFWVSFPVWAQNYEQAYTVADVKVDTLAESAVKARDKAFGEAQKAAFTKLALRFYSPEEASGLAIPDARTLAGMVQDFEVVSEQLSTKRYVGTYIFRFKANAVNRYFGKTPQYGGGQGGQVANSGTLILPFLRQNNGTTILWDATKNPWLQAWQQAKDMEDTFILPMGDVSDIMDVRDEQVSSNPAGLRRMMTRYNARDVAILIAAATKDPKAPLSIEIYRSARPSPVLVTTRTISAGSGATLSGLMADGVSLVRQDLKAGILTGAVMNPEESSPSSEEISGSPGGQQTASAAQAYTPLSGQIRVQTRFSNITEWLAIRRTLNSIPSLTGVKIAALKANEAMVDLTYSDWAAMTSALTSRGLVLSASNAGNYQLSRQVGGMSYR